MQTVALFLDAYRELNAKRLFWVVLVLSLIVVASFAMLGINEEGISFLWWTTSAFGIDSSILAPETFYKSIFSSLGIAIWLTWVATILALVSTASLVPDLISGGAIELLLSRPISRVRLFLTKYVMGLLFVTLQVGVFCTASFLVIGIRGKAWEPGLFLAVPLVVAFFSYLFCVCALLGLLTRSTITSLLLTLLVWAMIFGLHSGESIVNMGRIASEQELRLVAEDIEFREQDIANAEKRLAEREAAEDAEATESADARLAERLATKRVSLELRRDEHGEAETRLETWRRIHTIVIGVKTAAPKTAETIALLERWLIDVTELPQTDTAEPKKPPLTDAIANINVGMTDPSVVEQMTGELRERSPFWIIGTSLIFEAVILAIASFIFARRNF